MVKTIDEILLLPFSSRTKSQQLDILLEGKPRPDMSDHYLDREIKFHSDCYDKEQWLTACDKRGTFYCWSCLLFAQECGTMWVTEGYHDYGHLCKSIRQHNSTVDHIGGLLKLKNFIHENLTEIARPNTSKKSENVNKNFLERLFKFVCHDMMTSLSPQNVNDYREYVLETCTDALNVFKTYEMENFKTDLNRINWAEIVPGILKTLSDVVKMVIKEEMQDSTHVSLIISEHSRGDGEVLVSFVFRYLKRWKVRERFEGFYRVRDFELVSCVTNVLKKYEIEAKILSFSYDGAAVSREVLQSLVVHMQKAYGAIFVPCYFHSFETIIERSVSQIDSSCDIFFKTLRSMRSYIKSSSKIFNSFSALVQDVTHLDLNRDSFRFIRLLRKHRSMFVNFFNAVISHHTEWTGDDVVKAMEFRRTLQNNETVFWIRIFCNLSDLIVAVSDVLSSFSPERIFGIAHYENCQNFLSNMKQNLHESWQAACSEIENLRPNVSNSEELQEMSTKLRDQCCKVMDHLIDVMRIRMEPIEHLNFFALLNPQNSEQLHLTESAHQCLGDESFQIENVKKEMQQKFPFFNGRTVHNLMKFLIRNNLQDRFESVYKLAKVILSMPCKPASSGGKSAEVNPDASSEVPEIQETSANQADMVPKLSRKKSWKLDAIHSFSRGCSRSFVIANSWSVLFVEKDIVSSLPLREQFDVYLRMFKNENPSLKNVKCI